MSPHKLFITRLKHLEHVTRLGRGEGTSMEDVSQQLWRPQDKLCSPDGQITSIDKFSSGILLYIHCPCLEHL